MSKGKVLIIAIQEAQLSIITKQIEEIFSDDINIRSMTVKDLTMKMVETDEIILLSTSLIAPLVMSIIPQGVTSFIIKRGINMMNIKRLLDIPEGKNILVVNDTQNNTEEIIEELKENVFEHSYYPYCPDEPIPDFIDYVITPGEIDLIPKGISNVIDIGARVIDIETIFEINKCFQMQYKNSLLVKRYIKSLVSIPFENDFINEGREQDAHQSDIDKNNVNFTFEDIITESKAMKDLIFIAKKISTTDKPVYIIGETGSGKSMIAQAIHNESDFKNRPFININCATRSMDNLEKELFGIEKERQYIPSLFEMAEGGTLCIEEIGEMPLELQGRLVQAIEEGKIIRSQGEKLIEINVRIIITSSIDISELVSKKLFRKDLFYLIFTFTLRVPSLEERKEDFEPLVRMCLRKYLNSEDIIITDDVMESLKEYAWYGNARELFNVISYMASLNEKIITEKCMPYFVKIKNKANRIIVDSTKVNEKEIIQSLENKGFLKESIAILELFAEGKKKNNSYGRAVVIKLLLNKGFSITDQQLRLRLQVLNKLNLLIIRQGRSGTTISRDGERFLEQIK